MRLQSRDSARGVRLQSRDSARGVRLQSRDSTRHLISLSALYAVQWRVGAGGDGRFRYVSSSGRRVEGTGCPQRALLSRALAVVDELT